MQSPPLGATGALLPAAAPPWRLGTYRTTPLKSLPMPRPMLGWLLNPYVVAIEKGERPTLKKN
jgi:hypothetical protein